MTIKPKKIKGKRAKGKDVTKRDKRNRNQKDAFVLTKVQKTKTRRVQMEKALKDGGRRSAKGCDIRLSRALGARGLAARFAASHFDGCG
jgi:hypothetical protein